MGITVREADHASFKQALGSFAGGVNVVTVRDSVGQPHGVTVSAFSSVSLEPLLVLICLNRENRTHDLIVKSRRFGVNLLSESLHEISNYCARPGADKILDATWLYTGNGISTPALRDALVHLDCSVYAQHQAGTHTVFIGHVETVAINEAEDKPLLYYRGSYRSLEDRLPVTS